MVKIAQVLQLRGKLELLTKQTEVTGGEADIDAGKKADVDINLTNVSIAKEDFLICRIGSVSIL